MSVDVAVSAIVDSIVLFAPALFFIALGAGKWGFMVGLNGGAVVGYSLCPQVGILFPDWILIAVVIIDIFVLIFAWKGASK